MFISNAFSRRTCLDLEKSVSILSTTKLKRLNHMEKTVSILKKKKRLKKVKSHSFYKLSQY